MRIAAMAQRNGTSEQGRPGTALDLMALIGDGALSKVACVAAELRIPDLLASGPKHADALAHASESHAPSLHRLLRALVSLDLCAEREDGSFALTPMGSLLRTDVADSLRSRTLYLGLYQGVAWAHLLRSVKTGESARKLANGAGYSGHLERDPDAAGIFNGAMMELTRLVATRVVQSYDFAGARRIVDVGGGYGTMLAAVLEAYPSLHGVLFDRPHAIDGARAHLASAGVADRCELIAGDFFDSVPGDTGVYLLKAVIHDWNDEQSIAILRNCRGAMAGDARLLIVERILPARFEACPLHRAIARVDLVMLVERGGRERTEAEFRTLLDASGFDLARIFQTDFEYSVMECVPH
jgi:orsellinic acid C2-O-methyltransferase